MSDVLPFWACSALALLTVLVMIPARIEIRRRRDDLSARVQSLVSHK